MERLFNTYMPAFGSNTYFIFILQSLKSRYPAKEVKKPASHPKVSGD
jgi:hypothetical protein